MCIRVYIVHSLAASHRNLAIIDVTPANGKSAETFVTGTETTDCALLDGQGLFRAWVTILSWATDLPTTHYDLEWNCTWKESSVIVGLDGVGQCEFPVLWSLPADFHSRTHYLVYFIHVAAHTRVDCSRQRSSNADLGLGPEAFFILSDRCVDRATTMQVRYVQITPPG